MVYIMGKKKRRRKNTKVLGKTPEATQPIEIPTLDSEPQSHEQHFDLFPFPMVSLREDYDVYRILITGEKTVIGYFGIFITSGKFNYVIIREKSEINESQLLLFLKNFIKSSGLIPKLNPRIERFS